jgi:hypothetical protein
MDVATSEARGGVRAAAMAAAIFLLLTILLTWPAAIRLSDGITDNWDAELNAWVLNWDYHQLLADPAHLFDANIFYPARYALAFSENLLGVAVLGFPLFALGLSYIQVYNVLLLTGFFSSALAAWALARRITDDPTASLAAGLLYAFVPWRFAQISHFQFQWGAFLALTLLFLLRYLERDSLRDLVLFGLFLFWNALANMHYAIFSVLLVFAVLAEDAARPGFRRRLPTYWRVALACLVAAALFLPVALNYRKAATLYGFKRTLVEASFYSARPQDFLDAGPSKIYGWLSRSWKDRREALFPGITLLLLGAFGATRPLTGEFRRRARRLGLLLAGIGVLIALGTHTPIYGALFRISGPFFQAIRVPARGIVLFHIGLGMLAALGLSALRSRFTGRVNRFAVPAVLLGLAVAEYAAFPLVVFWADPRPAPVYRWIARAPFAGAAIELPFGLDYDIEYVFRSVSHFRPIVNGYSGFFPRDYDALNALFEQRPIPTQVWRDIERLGARLVVYHPHLLVDGRETDYAQLLKEGIEAGRIVPLSGFPHAGRQDFVFNLGKTRTRIVSREESDSAGREFGQYLQNTRAQADRPFGWLDLPKDGQSVSPGEAGYGWALARSGIAEIRLSTEEAHTGQVSYGSSHPGVSEAHPSYPDTDRAGFTFRIPTLSSGVHQLYFTIVARNGAEAVLERWIRVK